MQEEKFLDTNQFAESFNVQGSTVRRSFCVSGHYMGIVPLKWPNGRLGWPKSQRDRILKGQAPEQQ